MSLNFELFQKLMAVVMPTLTGKKKCTYLLRKVISIIEKCADEYPGVKFTYETKLGESIYDTCCRLEFDKFPHILSIQTNGNHIGNDFCDCALVSKGRPGFMSYNQWGYSKYDSTRFYDDELFEKHMKKIFSDLDNETYTAPTETGNDAVEPNNDAVEPNNDVVEPDNDLISKADAELFDNI
jgi:hypothetical protein